MRHHHFFAAHVVESIALHLRECPLDRTLETLRPAESMTDMVRQVGQPRVGAITNQGCADDASGSRAILIDRDSRWRQRCWCWRGRRILCEQRNTDHY